MTTMTTIRSQNLTLDHPWPALGGGVLESRAVALLEGLSPTGATVALGEGATALGAGESVEAVVRWMRRHSATIPLEDHGACMACLGDQQEDPPPRAAMAAFEMAALDIQGRRCGAPLWKMLQLPDPTGRIVPVTLAPIRPESYRDQVMAHADGPVITLRLGHNGPAQDIRCVQLARLKSQAILRVDAGGAWTLDEAREALHALAAAGVEYVEQPLAPGQLDAMRALHETSPLALFLDEDIASAADVERVAPCCDGVRISLARVGGVSEALAAIIKARELGLLVCVGSDLESPVATTAAAHLAGLAEYCDFYGPSFLSASDFSGMRIQDHRIQMPDRPGLGVVRRSDGL